MEFYGEFIQQCDRSKPERNGGSFRITEKQVKAQSKDGEVSVVATSPDSPESACAEIARLARDLLKKGKVADPNQITFLYPSLKTVQVGRMIKALEDVGLKVYAPRANPFLKVDEAVALFGVFLRLFGRPEKGDYSGKDYDAFHDWLDNCQAKADELLADDPALVRFIRERQREIETVIADHAALQATLASEGWSRQTSFALGTMLPALLATEGLSMALWKTDPALLR